ncbi:MAG: GNAT family N-acetyltransferase [Planctomycetaceae bacterium]|nr:GNAT family N-acetyltransferase [Planctomycetaceae bacterium]
MSLLPYWSVSMSVAQLPERTSSADAQPKRDRKSTQSATQTVRQSGDVWIEFAEQLEDIRQHRLDWGDLGQHVAEANVFQTWWMLLAVWEQLPPDERPRVAFIYEQPSPITESPLLIGVFPLVKRRGCYGLPITVWQLWTHRLLFLNTPLVRAGHEIPALSALFDWLKESRSATAIELQGIPGERAMSQALIHLLDSTERTSFAVNRYCRAFIRRRGTYDDYLDSLPGHTRREFGRLRRQLERMGQLEVRSLNSGDDVEPWIDQFLELESRGWKGRGQTALKTSGEDEQIFRHITREAGKRDQLDMLGLFLDGQPIALKCNFLMGRGAYAFKIAYDEKYSKQSPGVQLELENIRRLLESERTDWMDSCAVARHSMIDRLWKERRVIETRLVSSGRFGSDALLAMYPVLRAAKRELGRLLPQAKN